MVLEVATPGLLVVKHHRGEVGKFVNVAVLEGEQIKIIDEQASSLPDCPELLVSLLGFDGAGEARTPRQRARPARGVDARARPRRHSAGRAAGSDAWRSLDRAPDPVPGGAGLFGAGVARAQPAARSRGPVKPGSPEAMTRVWQDALEDTVSWIAGLTAVDGATIITERYDLLAFGAKIARRDGHPLVEQRDGDRADRRRVADIVHPDRSRRHASPLGRAVRPRSAGRPRAGRVAGRPVYRLRLVPLRNHGPRAPGRDAATLGFTVGLRLRLGLKPA